MHPLLLIQTGEAPDAIRARLGGFADWFRVAMRVRTERLHVVRVDAGAALPAPSEVAGAVISGSAAMVTDRAPWSEATAAWIRRALDQGVAVLGVCYGHQLMAHALGGRVDWMPTREIGTRELRSLAGIDAGAPTWRAHTTHRQAVVALPEGAQSLAASKLDPNQLVRYAPHALSMQFHPEFSAEVMRAYIRARADQLRDEGLDVHAIHAATAPTPRARAMLRRFAQAALAPGEGISPVAAALGEGAVA